MLVVYLLNGSAVVMNYQFVNGFLFTIAGILSAQNGTRADPASAASAQFGKLTMSIIYL